MKKPSKPTRKRSIKETRLIDILNDNMDKDSMITAISNVDFDYCDSVYYYFDGPCIILIKEELENEEAFNKRLKKYKQKYREYKNFLEENKDKIQDELAKNIQKKRERLLKELAKLDEATKNSSDNS